MGITRRDFALFLGKTAVLTGVLGSLLLLASQEVKQRRPPGAVEEGIFKLVCLRCGRCGEACPARVIRFVKLSENLPFAGTPVLLDNGVCQLCFNCVDVCPSGALQPVPKEKAKMGTAYINRDKCIGCGICIKICNQVVSAISWANRRKSKAIIDPGKCLGCGACVPECPVQAIKLTPENAYRPPFAWPKGA